METTKLENSPDEAQNDQAHRHGGGKTDAAECAAKLKQAVEATYDSVFDTEHCSTFKEVSDSASEFSRQGLSL